jgi:hypothetical protein
VSNPKSLLASSSGRYNADKGAMEVMRRGDLTFSIETSNEVYGERHTTLRHGDGRERSSTSVVAGSFEEGPGYRCLQHGCQL